MHVSIGPLERGLVYTSVLSPRGLFLVGSSSVSFSFEQLRAVESREACSRIRETNRTTDDVANFFGEILGAARHCHIDPGLKQIQPTIRILRHLAAQGPGRGASGVGSQRPMPGTRSIRLRSAFLPSGEDSDFAYQEMTIQSKDPTVKA